MIIGKVKDRRYIKDFSGRILGSIESDYQGNKLARDFSGRIVGRYEAATDLTKDFSGRVVYHGDQISAMIPRKK